MAKKKLYIMCGPAGSGKSTWIRCNAEAGTSAHISRDRIRFNMVKEDEYYFSREDEVYREFTRQIYSALCREWVDSVYADATHLTKKAREKLIREIDALYPAGYYDVIAVVVKPELEVCLAQNAQRKGRECVPESVIRNMYNSFQHPLNDDLRYDRIIENDVCVYGTEGN
jgi:predicted kinase